MRVNTKDTIKCFREYDEARTDERGLMKVTTGELYLNTPPFAGESHYIGSFPRDGEIYDYYNVEIIIEGEKGEVLDKGTMSRGEHEVKWQD